MKIDHLIKRKSDFISAVNSDYRDRGKPIRDLTGLIPFFLQKMDSVLKMSLSIEYHTKSDPPLVRRLPQSKAIFQPYFTEYFEALFMQLVCSLLKSIENLYGTH